jgi:hypothetical protein
VSLDPGSPEPDPIRIAREILTRGTVLASTLDLYAGTSRLSVYADYLRDDQRKDVQRGGAQGNLPLSWGDAKSPIPGQVYVTPQATRG